MPNNRQTKKQRQLRTVRSQARMISEAMFQEGASGRSKVQAIRWELLHEDDLFMVSEILRHARDWLHSSEHRQIALGKNQ